MKIFKVRAVRAARAPAGMATAAAAPPVELPVKMRRVLDWVGDTCRVLATGWAERSSSGVHPMSKTV